VERRSQHIAPLNSASKKKKGKRRGKGKGRARELSPSGSILRSIPGDPFGESGESKGE